MIINENKKKRTELIFNGNCFSPKVFIESLLTKVLSEAGLFEATEGRGDVRLVIAVDKTGSGVYLLRYVQSFGYVFSEDTRRQTELRVVGPTENTLDVAVGKGADDHNRTERLLPRDIHIVGNAGEYRRHKEESGSLHLLTPVHEFGPLLDPDYSVLD